MKGPLSYAVFRAVFASQVFSLLGIGLLTVALSLSAYSIGGKEAGGQVLGFLLALKMVAYVVLAPLAETALAGRSRKSVMVLLDVGRMLLLLPMVFATEIWQIAALAFAFFALSSAFTPLFQSVIPDILPDEDTYSRALAYSRVAYTLEAVLSPVVAAMVLRVVASESLFLFAAFSFVGSITALVIARFPGDHVSDKRGSFLKRAAKGMNIYVRTPRLRGLFLINLALSLAMAWVLVNTAVYAGNRLGDPDYYYPILMASYGIGAALGAVLVPKMVRVAGERRVMMSGAWIFAALGGMILLPLAISGLLALWAGFGFASSLVLTPGGLVIARSAAARDRASVFAAQFSLSHAGWLVAYPLAGWMSVWIGLETALVTLSALCAMTVFVATRVWKASDTAELAHSHPELAPDHPHLKECHAVGPDNKHVHVFHIDALHPNWIKPCVA
ncbi:MAG: MFS transporter [Paracoccaceae bacterium]|nr:MFS transporter [Paracoccaceae bacterium]